LRPGAVVLVKGSRGVHLERAIEIAKASSAEEK
jgi:UDP-N-acetylmuramyl pentapeptide synthase